MRVFVVLLVLGAVCRGEDNSLDTALNIIRDCNGDYTTCLKEKILTVVDNVRASKSLTLVSGISLKADSEKKLPRKDEPLPSDPEQRDAELNSRILDGVLGVAETHRLEVNLGDSEAGESVKRSLEEGRKKKKGMSGLGAIAGLILLKLGLKKLLLVKLLALKALVVGKIALAIAAFLLLSHLFNQGHTKTTYEVVPHHHESHHEVSHHPHVEHSFASHGDHGAHFGAHSEPHFSSFSAGSSGVSDGDWNKNVESSHNVAYSGHAGYSRK